VTSRLGAHSLAIPHSSSRRKTQPVRRLSSFTVTLAAIVLAGLNVLCTAEENPRIDPRADEVIRRLADYYAGLKTFSVDFRLDVRLQIGEDSTKTKAAYSLAMCKPDKLAVLQKDDARGMSVVCDGHNVYTLLSATNTYSVAQAPKTLDELLSKGGVTMLTLTGTNAGLSPSALIMSKPYDIIVTGVTEGNYVGLEELGDVKCHHVRFCQPTGDWDAWIEDGERPLLRKLVPDMRKTLVKLEGAADAAKKIELDMTITFENWAMDIEMSEERFRFEPPKGALRIEMPAE
jgi:hypothetical protein